MLLEAAHFLPQICLCATATLESSFICVIPDTSKPGTNWRCHRRKPLPTPGTMAEAAAGTPVHPGLAEVVGRGRGGLLTHSGDTRKAVHTTPHAHKSPSNQSGRCAWHTTLPIACGQRT